jgi:hypothetical protein
VPSNSGTTPESFIGAHRRLFLVRSHEALLRQNPVTKQNQTLLKKSIIALLVLLSSFIEIPKSQAAEGETWTTNTFPVTLTSPRVFYGGNLFILNDDFSGVFYTSTDGINWTSRAVSTSFRYMHDFAYGNGIYVATGQNESVQGAGQPVKMFYSNDGINWSLTNTIPGWANQWVVAFGNNKFVAAKGGSCSTSCISYSSDGINWSLATTPNLGSGPITNFTDIIYTGTTFYAVSGGGAVITSSDGVSWTYQTTISGISTWTDYVNELAFGNSTVVGVGPNGRVNTSTSPSTWVKRTASPSGSISWNDITFGQSTFVAVSSQGYVMRSDDGVTWTSSGSISASSIAYGNGTFVAFGAGSSFYTSASTPSAPTSLSATAGDGQATISFTPGSDGGSAITNYKYSTDGTNYTALSPTDSSSPVTIPGLTNGTSYTIYLKAVNANGDSSASSSVTVTPSTTPSAPTSLSATAGDEQATINFTPGSNGGSAITNYKYSTDGTNYTALSPTDSSSPVTISGLTNGTSYTIYLKAVNANGDSAASSSVTVTPSSTPSAPTSLSATAGDGQATISFTPGSDGGSAISNYKYSTDGTTYTALSPTDNSSPVTITGLTNGTSYTIYLKAVNANGDSSASSSVTVTPVAPPVSNPVAPQVSNNDSSDPVGYFKPIRKVELRKQKISWKPNSKIVILKYDFSNKKTTIIKSVQGEMVLPKAKPGQTLFYSIMATDGTVLKKVTMKTKPKVPKIAKLAAQKSQLLAVNNKTAITAQWKKDKSVKRYRVTIKLDNGKVLAFTTTDPNINLVIDETKSATITITAIGKNNLTSTVTRKI